MFTVKNIEGVKLGFYEHCGGMETFLHSSF